MNALFQLLGLGGGSSVHRLVHGDWHCNLIFPPWAVGTILAVGTAMALINFLPQIAMRRWVRLGTFALRLGMLALLLVILLGLEWQVALELNEKQNWTVLLDDSASMATQDVDGRSRYAAALADLDAIRTGLGAKVRVSVQTISGSASPGAEPGQGPTRFQEAIPRAALARDHVDRLVLLSDGRDSDNRDLKRLGEDLRARDTGLSVRLYGTATPPVDRGITAEPQRNVLRLGEEMTIRGQITGNRDNGEENVTLSEDGRAVKTFPVALKPNGRFEVGHRPKQKGQHVYTLDLASTDALALNNRVSFVVQVLEEKINVLLIEGFPRFEFKLMKAVLEVDPLVNLVSMVHLPGGGVYVQGNPLHRNPEQGLITSPAELFKYDVVILRDVPRNYFRADGDATESRLLNIVQFVTKRGGGLMVFGGEDVYRAGGYQDSPLAPILPFDLSNRLAGEDQFEGLFYVTIPKPAYDHPILQLLANPAENRERLNGLRQLDGSNNVGGFKPLATPLMTRLVQLKGKDEKPVEKESPILAYMAVGEGKVIAGAVDTLWRWQLQPDFDDPPLTMLLANAVRFVAPPPGRRPGQPDVTLENTLPRVGQEVELSTDLRDANYDPLQERDLTVVVQRPDGSSGRMFPRDLPEEPGHYVYRVGLDQPGRYKVTAHYDKFESTREFVAGAAAGELADLSADRPAMEQLAQAAGGEVMAADLSAWLSKVDVTPARQPATRSLKVWNSPLVLLLFFAMVSTDCYLRKRQGLA
jgi:hypothetical protein